MNNEALVIDLKPSKIYLSLCICVYLLSLYSIWAYFHNLELSVFLSAIVIIFAFYFLPKNVLLKQSQSLQKIKLNGSIMLINNNGKISNYQSFYAVHQSNFLIVIGVGKQFVVIFKDAVQQQDFFKLRQIINVGD